MRLVLSTTAVTLMLLGCSPDPKDADTVGAAADSTTAPPPKAETPIERDLPDTLVNTTVLDTLRSASGEAWLVIAGVECNNCDAPETIWLTRDLARGPEHGPYDYPGEDFEMGVEDAEPHGRSRLFAGNCLAEAGDELVLILEERGSSGGWSASMHVVRLESQPVDTTMAYSAALERRLTTASECSEIPGKEQYGG